MINKLTKKIWFWCLILAISASVETFCLTLLDWVETNYNNILIDALRIFVIAGAMIIAFEIGIQMDKHFDE